MVALITKPGVYQIPAEQYHGQLTPSPSMSAGMAIDIIAECPRKMLDGCYLNPDWVPDNRADFDLGTAGHVALLEPDEWAARVAIVDAENYKTNAAKAAREAAYEAGKTPLLPKHADQVMGIRKAVLAHKTASAAIANGKSELSVIAQDRKTGVWLKCRPDKSAPDWSWLADLKTTTNVHPRALQKKAHDDGWAQRAEWYLDVVQGATGIRPAHYYFIAVEVKPPHLVKVCRYKARIAEKPRALEWGAIMNRRAIDLFAECVATGQWPGYGDDVLELDLPSYAEFQLEERRDAGEFTTKPSAALLRQAAEFQSPIGA